MEELDNIQQLMPFMSTQIDQVSAALSAFQGEVVQPVLNRENPYFKSRYVDLSGVLKTIQKALARNGLCVMQIIQGADLITLLSHKSGQWIRSVCPIGNYKNQQDRGSAITYTKRYALCAILGIAADTDDDGNSAADTDKAQEKLLDTAIKKVDGCSTSEELKAVYYEYKDIQKHPKFISAVSKRKKEIG